MTENVEIEFELTMDDWRAFHMYHLRQSPMIRRQYLFNVVIYPGLWAVVCCFIWYMASQQDGDYGAKFLALLPLFSGVLIYPVVFAFWFPYRTRRNIAQLLAEGKSHSFLGHHVFKIDSEGVTDTERTRSQAVRWCGIERIASTDDYLFIYINAVDAMIVPRRAFTHQKDFDKIVSIICSNISNEER